MSAGGDAKLFARVSQVIFSNVRCHSFEFIYVYAS